jgi:AraC family transcriptional regulator
MLKSWHVVGGKVMSPRLLSGQFFGRVARRRVIGDLQLIETRYAPGTHVPRHCHEHAYFCLVRRGRYREEYNGRHRSCGPLTVALHAAGEIHAEEFANEEAWSFNVELSEASLDRWQLSRLDWTADFRGGAIAGLALRLYSEFQRADQAAPLAIEGLTLEILAEAWRGSFRGVERHPPRWLARLRDLLADRFAEPPTLAELAERAHVHPVYVAASFRRHYRCTVGDFVRRRRVEFACHQLAASDATLAEIALSAGFADQSHFCRVFKRLTGVTPANYRRSANQA